jgi:lysophospholipase L1-like esterase
MNPILAAAVLFCAMVGTVLAEDLSALRAAFEKPWPGNRSINLVFHGHSVPAGYQKTPEVRTFEAYPHLLQVKLKERYPNAVINVIVTAIGGDDSVAGAARFERDVLPHKPDLLFIDYALNDRRKPIEQVEAAWCSMIASARKNGIPLVLVTPTGDSTADLADPNDGLRQCADLIRRLAGREKVLLADVSAAWLAELSRGTRQDLLLSQSNHPNLRGNQIAADSLFITISKQPHSNP